MSVDGRPFVRGDVVARSGREAVVWIVETDHLVILPIVALSEARHRADIEFSDADMVGILASRRGLVRCCAPIAVRARSQIPIGRLSPELIRALGAAIRRELDAQALERSPRVASHLDRCDGRNRGRQIGPRNLG